MAVSKARSKSELTCPVCGMEVDESSEFSATIQGETFYFCSDEDREEFQKQPSKYLKEKAA